MAGSSKDPCKETYLGQSPFSEHETSNIKKFFESLSPVPVLAMSVHSALNAMLYGRSYADGVFVDNKDETVGKIVLKDLVVVVVALLLPVVAVALLLLLLLLLPLFLLLLLLLIVLLLLLLPVVLGPHYLLHQFVHDFKIAACEAFIEALNKVHNQNFTCMHGPDLCERCSRNHI